MSDHVNVQDLADRLRSLEATCETLSRRATTWKHLTLCCLLAFTLILFAGAQQAVRGPVSATKFTLVDALNKERAVLGIDSDGTAELTLHDEARVKHARFGVAANGIATLSLWGRDARPQISLSVLPDDWAKLTILPKQGGGGLELSVLANGSSGIAHFDDRGNMRYSIAHDTVDDTSILCLVDKGGVVSHRLGVSEDGPFSQFVGKDDTSRFEQLLDKNGMVAVHLNNPKGEPQIAFAIQPDGAIKLHLGNIGQQKGSGGLSLRVDPTKGVDFSVQDKEGKGRLGFGIDPGGSYGMSIVDKDGNLRLGIGIDENQSPLIQLLDKDGNILFGQP